MLCSLFSTARAGETSTGEIKTAAFFSASSSSAVSLRTLERRCRVMHWLTAMRCSQDETFASPRKPRKLRKAARNVSCVASRASSSRPSIPNASANMRLSQRRTISPNASGSPDKARSTICSSVVAVFIWIVLARAARAFAKCEAPATQCSQVFRRHRRRASLQKYGTNQE